MNNVNKEQKVTIENLKCDLDTVTQEIKDLKVTLAEKDKKINKLKEDMITLNKMNEENKEQIKKLANEKIETIKQVKSTEAGIYSLQKDKSIVIEEKIKLTKENEKLKENNTKLIITIANEETIRNEMKQQLMKEFNDKINEAYDKCDKVTAELNKTVDNYNRIHTKYLKLKKN